MDYAVVGFKRDGSGPYFRHRTKGTWTLHKNQRRRDTREGALRVAENCNRLYTENPETGWSDFGIVALKPRRRKK